MNDLVFEWDPIKADLNYAKHNVTFEEAKSVFYDENAVLISDPDHSEYEEDRFLLLGFSAEFCHCYRENDCIRIISARKANKAEVKEYRGRNGKTL